MLATNGSMQADAFLFQQLVGPGDVVVVEAPTYDRTLLSLRKLGAEILAIPLEADGIDVGGARGRARGGRAAEARPHHPQLPEPGRLHAVAREARSGCSSSRAEYDFMIFEDDPYVELRFEGEPLPTMLVARRGRGRVVYASSFSKTVCPGIRVGYLVGPGGPDRRRSASCATETYISPNMVAQAIVAEFCDSGAVDRSIATVKAALRERRDATAAALERHFPRPRFVTPEGGYFLWVDLPEGTDVAALAAGATERGVVFVKGTDFMIEGGESSLRLAYSAVPPDQIEEGVARIAEAYRELPGAGCVTLELERPRDVGALLGDSLGVYRRTAGVPRAERGRGRARPS